MRVLPAVATASLLVLAACGGNGGESSSDGNTIPVAIMDAQTGPLSTIGLPSLRGAVMAFDEINEAGGIEINGEKYTVAFTPTDRQRDATVAASAAQEAIAKDKVKVLIGATTSAVADPAAAAVLRAGDQTLMLAPATVMDKYTGPDSMLFRTLLNEQDAAAQYVPALRKLFPEVETVSALMIDDAIGESILSVYPPLFEENGFSVESTDGFPADTSNFMPLINRTPDDVDAFFTGYTDAAAAAVVGAADEAQRAGVFFTRGTTCAVGMDMPDQIEALTCQVFNEDPNAPSTPEAEEFFAAYEAKFDEKVDPNSGSALSTYDWIYLLAQAFEEAGTADDMPAVAEALRGASYDGVVQVGFTDEGLADATLKIGVVRDGKIEIHEARE